MRMSVVSRSNASEEGVVRVERRSGEVEWRYERSAQAITGACFPRGVDFKCSGYGSFE